MSDVNLNSPDLKLASTAGQSPVRALSSSQVPGVPGPDLSAAANAAEAVNGSQNTPQVPSADRIQARNEAQSDRLEEAVSRLNEFVQNVQRDLQFEVDNNLGQTVVRVVDQQTQEVIRQIPDEVALRLAEKLQQDEPLTLFNIKA